MTTLVELTGLELKYPTSKVAVLSEISLTISTGESLSIVGPSGSGKTSLLRLICGLTLPTAGEIRWHGTQKASAVLLAQEPERTLISWRTVWQNVILPLEKNLFGSSRALADSADYYLKIVGLLAYRDQYPVHLSGGMLQRLAIARALACESRLLLLDEPFSALDIKTRRDLQDQLLQIKEITGSALVTVCHDIDDAIFMGTNVLLLKGVPAKIQDCYTISAPFPRSQRRFRESPEFHKNRIAITNNLLAT